MNPIRLSPHAGMVLCTLLLASTPIKAQQSQVSIEPPRSVISLVAAPKPEGELLARRPGDSTFERAPANYHVFAAATVGQDAGVEVLTLSFAGETKVTGIESKSEDFIVEAGGTCHEGNSYGRGDSCTLLVRFNPRGPGHRLGFVTIAHSAEAAPMSIGLTGNGYAPVVSFTPSEITTVSGTAGGGKGTIKSATNLAIDGGDILYIPDNGNNLFKEIDSSGAITSITPSFTGPDYIAVDNYGNIFNVSPGTTYPFNYITPWGLQAADAYTYVSSNCTASAPCAFSSVGMSNPNHLSIDAYDDLFFEESTTGAAEMPVGGLSGGIGSLDIWHLSDEYAFSGNQAPQSFAVDAGGNLYTSYISSGTNLCSLLEEPLYAAEYNATFTRVAGASKCGFSGDGGQARDAEISGAIGQIAFDTAGNLYFADAGNQRVRRIDSLTGIISTIAGNGVATFTGDNGPATKAGLTSPSGVAVDSQGQVYILVNAPAAGPTQGIRKVETNGFWAFQPQLKGTTSPVNVFTVANTGNDTLTLSANAIFTGANPSDFAIDPTTTSCVHTAGATLVYRHSCKIGIAFKPTAGGARSASLLLLDNTVNNLNVIDLKGTGLLAPTMSITSPTAGSSVTKGATVTFAVSVTSSSSPKPTGSVTFKVNGSTIGSAVTLSTSGTASTTFTASSLGTNTLSASYSGDANFAATTVSESLTVTASAKAAVSVGLAPAADPSRTCAGRSFSVQVSSAAGGIPSGTVKLKSGSVSLAVATLSNGRAMLTVRSLDPGPHTIVAHYGGDSVHDAAASAPVLLTVPLLGSSCIAGYPLSASAMK
jgi:hypothetical protein